MIQVAACILAIMLLATSALAEPWLSPELKTSLKDVTQIEYSEIESMIRTPRIVLPGDPEFYKKLAGTKQKRLLEILGQAQAIDPATRFSECKYLPGIELSIKSRDQKNLGILVCFNCDLFAVGSWHERHAATAVQSYGDLRPFREELSVLLSKQP